VTQPVKYPPNHRPGDRYVRAMLVLQEVDARGEPVPHTTAAAEVVSKIDRLELSHYAGYNADLLSQAGGVALHNMLRETPQGALIYRFRQTLEDAVTSSND
jgi:hypothetical protein